jgi:hypothetical protein
MTALMIRMRTDKLQWGLQRSGHEHDSAYDKNAYRYTLIPPWPYRLPPSCRLFPRTAQNRVSILLCILEATSSILGPEAVYNKNYRGFIQFT